MDGKAPGIEGRSPAMHHGHGTGSTNDRGLEDEVERLRQQVENLQLENRNLHSQVETLQATAHDNPGAGKQQSEEDTTDEAMRKRLSRLCERKKSGLLVFNFKALIMCVCASSCELTCIAELPFKFC